MILTSVVACLSLVATLPAAAAPLATSTVIRAPGIATLTVGMVEPTEMSNLPGNKPGELSSFSNAENHVFALHQLENSMPGMVAAKDHSPIPIIRRQIRIDNFDATHNTSMPLLSKSYMMKRGKKEAKAMEAARQAQSAQPSGAPPPQPQHATPAELMSSGVKTLGEERLESSYMAHDLLGTASNPDAALQSNESATTTSTAAAVTPTVKKAKQSTPQPVGPGYATDTMDVPMGEPAQAKSKRHSFMVNMNELLPEQSPTPTSPVQAWQNDAIFELDSNHAPSPVPQVPQNVTSAAGNVTSAAQQVKSGNAMKSS